MRLAVWSLVAVLFGIAIWLLALTGAISLVRDFGEEPCARGAISAIGPVDAEGRGDTITPEEPKP